MILKNALSLAGKFTFKVYSKDNSLKYSEDVNNFITPTGLSYLETYAFADCFRYLSLGSGSLPNTATGGGIGTTGLQIPIPRFSYIGGNNQHTACIEQNTQYLGKSCGYRVLDSGISLFRTWRVPFNDSHFITGNFNFKEYGLSPGRPGVTGWFNFDELTSGTICSCDESVWPVYGDGNAPSHGPESYDFAHYYPDICSSTKMFTRVLKDISVQNDEYLTVTYALDVSVNTGTSTFKVNVFRNSPVGDEFNWVISSGAHSIVTPGIKLINNGDVSSVSYVSQIADYEFRAGESFIPPLGQGLELSCPDSSRIGYLSNDILQFLANSNVGGASGGEYINSVPSGLMLYHKDYVSETSANSSVLGGKVYNQSWFNRPRSEVTKDFATGYPSQSDFTVGADYSSIAEGTFIPQSIESTIVSSALDSSLPFTGRSRSRIVSLTFKQPSLEEKMPVRSFVYGYKGGTAEDYWYPTVDTIFFPTGINPYNKPGAMKIPTLNTVNKTYPNPSGLIDALGHTGYYYFDDFNNANILTMQIRNTINTTCPNGVSGCP